MRCADARTRLDAYLAGELPPGISGDIDGHLANCLPCREALARLRQLAEMLRQSQTPPVPDGFAERVMMAARQRRKDTPAIVLSWNPLAWRLSEPMRAAAAAMLVTGLGLGILMGRGAWRGPYPVGAVARTDPLAIYNLDYLTDAPNGSLSQSYLALVSGQNGQGR